MRHRLGRYLAVRAGLVVLGLGVGLLVAELFMRFYLEDAYYVWPPGWQHIFHPKPEIMPGIEGESSFTINALGVRGDPVTAGVEYRLVTVGGSTTMCGYLDDGEAWPYLVQERLNAALGAGTTWVGNAGRAGHSITHHVLQVKKLLMQNREIDAVVLLIGINDMLSSLKVLKHWDPRAGPPGFPRASLEQAFSVTLGTEADAPWYQRTGLGRLWRNWRPPVLTKEQEGLLMDRGGLIFAAWRRYRQEAGSILKDLPDLRPALAYYEQNLNRIVDAAGREDARILFLTQPSIWRPGLSQSERDRLWMGGPRVFRRRSGAEYYSVVALAEGMRLYNDRLLEVCEKRGVECLDLAARVPQDATIFWDDAHFTERGARRVAEVLADYLLASEPLASRRQRRPSP